MKKLTSFMQVAMILSLCFLLTGCGKLKNESKIKSYLNSHYGIPFDNMEIVSKDEHITDDKEDTYIEYTVKDTASGVVFTCITFWDDRDPMGVGGTLSFYYENTNSDYLEKVAELVTDEQIDAIQKKYNVTLTRTDSSSFVGKIKIVSESSTASNISKEDYQRIEGALTELNSLYHLYHPGQDIFVVVNDEYAADMYYSFVEGEKIAKYVRQDENTYMRVKD